MTLENNFIQEKVQQTFGADVAVFQQERDLFSFEVNSEKITALLLFLKNDPDLNFHFLTDLCAIHYPDNDLNEQFAVVYHMHNWVANKRIKIKTFLNGTNPELKTISTIFLCANWMEREAWDFYGINFVGHPQLKRILNMDEMISHPMRKEFPMEDGGRTDKDDRFFGRTVASN
jgi:NADH-quinone oxidoreductase subunit C